MFFAALCASCLVVFSQEYGQFHGTWFNAQFIEVLNKTASVERAMQAKAEADPLWVTIDSLNLEGKIATAFNLGTTNQMVLLKTSIPQAGMKWVVGTEASPRWIVSVDERNGSYIALTSIDNMEGKPAVLGKLPTKNTDPMFILRRMVNASVLSGTWLDQRGKVYSFSTGMMASMNKVSFSYELSINPTTFSVIITSTSGKPHSYVVQRMGNGLTLSSLHKNGTTMMPIVLKRKTP